MKKKLLIAALLVIAVSILAVGTAAYNSFRVYTHSVITSGGVKIQLSETMLNDKGSEVAYKDPDTLVPGQSVSKIVRVTNLEKDAFVRVKVELVGQLSDGTTQTVPLTFDYNKDQWKEVNGWYYYHTAMKKDQVTEPLFKTVTLSGEKMDKTWKGAKIEIKVTAQGLQTANNGTDPVKASGWSN